MLLRRTRKDDSIVTDTGEEIGVSWPFVRTMIILEEVDSTSDHAALLVRDDAVLLPLCVWANRQTRGRGRGTYSWWSGPGSLTFTLAIDPLAHGLVCESEPRLALATAVAVIEALGELGLGSPALGIRWPNDVEINARKLGGILPEPIETDRGRCLLIGVGINVLTELAAMPAAIRQMATSLSAMSGGQVDRDTTPRLLAAILDQFGSALGQLVVGDPELPRAWDRLDLLRDAWVSVDLGPRIIAGHGCGIDEDGALCLDDGLTRHHLFGGRVLR
jgi:BirA family transcriptional regulator, biotin operon repressor / biotin---[acetyl-CoA-carboxylase] ligase